MCARFQSWVGVTCLLAACSAGRAASVSDSLTYGSEAVPTSGHLIGDLDKFNPALGTLLKVTFELVASTRDSHMWWDNESAVPSDVTLGIGANVKVYETDPAGHLSLTGIPFNTASATAVAAHFAGDISTNFDGPDSFRFENPSSSDAQSQVITGPDMSRYTGTGVFDVMLQSNVNTLMQAHGGWGIIDPDPGTTAGVLRVTYEYTPVPLPPAIWGGMALLGLVAGRRWIRRSAENRRG